MRKLIESTNDKIGRSKEFLDRMKSNLGLDRNKAAEIAEGTAEYNLAVCRNVGRDIISALPQELRDMVFGYLTSKKLHIYIDRAHEQPSREEVYDEEDTKKIQCFSVVRELMDGFYRNSTFFIYPSDGSLPPAVGGVSSILYTDRFSKGTNSRQLIELDPLERHARIRLVIHNQYSWAAWYDEVQQELETLDAHMEIMFPELETLVRSGYRLTVELGNGWFNVGMAAHFSRWQGRLKEGSKIQK
ncbi:hypothetical protein EK21DRAFT_108233 [Setomelanomma holmii]|uniref:Uncharacterized protein n=1 Tax=Setomelanomma holmii TaxID=210430 RepID=A0A9P4HIH9_9PLEO|nr:hypothetical protein EK21DRAFT_108233 [Setomelanomma holmii]